MGLLDLVVSQWCTPYSLSFSNCVIELLILSPVVPRRPVALL
jgi:hypothetical protein